MSDPDTASTSREDEITLREKDVSFQHIAGISLSIHTQQCRFFVMEITGVGVGGGIFQQTYVGSIPNSTPYNSCLINLSMCMKGPLSAYAQSMSLSGETLVLGPLYVLFQIA